MKFFCIFLLKNLRMSKIFCNFVLDFKTNIIMDTCDIFVLGLMAVVILVIFIGGVSSSQENNK